MQAIDVSGVDMYSFAENGMEVAIGKIHVWRYDLLTVCGDQRREKDRSFLRAFSATILRCKMDEDRSARRELF